MVLVHHKSPRIRFYFHLGALLSALIFGNISTFAIYDILKDETVFMTNIHAIFLNPIFLLTGAYLGIYLLYTLSLKLHKKRTTY
jgi:hypothetical protein